MATRQRRGRFEPATHPDPTTPTLTVDERRELVPKLIHDLFRETRRNLTYWADITGQSAQVDSGYIAQHLVSLVTGIPGQDRRRGKGLDLADNSEVKTANNVDGIDKQRWNVQFQHDEQFPELLKHPYIFFVLIDKRATGEVRFRIYGIEPDVDEVFRASFQRWIESDRKSRNYQLHPPIGRDDDIVTNESGNMKMPKMSEAIVELDGSIVVTMLNTRPTGRCELVSVGRWDNHAGLAKSES